MKKKNDADLMIWVRGLIKIIVAILFIVPVVLVGAIFVNQFVVNFVFENLSLPPEYSLFDVFLFGGIPVIFVMGMFFIFLYHRILDFWKWLDKKVQRIGNKKAIIDEGGNNDYIRENNG